MHGYDGKIKATHLLHGTRWTQRLAESYLWLCWCQTRFRPPGSRCTSSSQCRPFWGSLSCHLSLGWPWCTWVDPRRGRKNRTGSKHERRPDTDTSGHQWRPQAGTSSTNSALTSLGFSSILTALTCSARSFSGSVPLNLCVWDRKKSLKE